MPLFSYNGRLWTRTSCTETLQSVFTSCPCELHWNYCLYFVLSDNYLIKFLSAVSQLKLDTVGYCHCLTKSYRLSDCNWSFSDPLSTFISLYGPDIRYQWTTLKVDVCTLHSGNFCIQPHQPGTYCVGVSYLIGLYFLATMYSCRL